MIFMLETWEDDNGESPTVDPTGSDDDEGVAVFAGKFLCTIVVKDAPADLAGLSEYISLTGWKMKSLGVGCWHSW